MSKNSKEVLWIGSYGCIDKITENSILITGMGVSYYPMCPHCKEYAYQDENNQEKSGNFKCMFCGGLQNPIDWKKRPASIPEEELDDYISDDELDEAVKEFENGNHSK